MLFHLSLEFVQSFGISSGRCHIVVLWPEPIWSKNGSLKRKSACLETKSIYFWEEEWFTFGPESGRVDEMQWELALKFKTTVTQQTMTEAKLQGQMEKHQIRKTETILISKLYVIIKFNYIFYNFLLKIWI